MSTLATRRLGFFSRPTMFALAFIILSFASPDASAQSGGRLQRYSEKFYGQNFYDGQHNILFAPRGTYLQYRQPVYGPAQMYGRQYGDENGYSTARPFARRQSDIKR